MSKAVKNMNYAFYYSPDGWIRSLGCELKLSCINKMTPIMSEPQKNEHLGVVLLKSRANNIN